MVMCICAFLGGIAVGIIAATGYIYFQVMSRWV